MSATKFHIHTKYVNINMITRWQKKTAVEDKSVLQYPNLLKHFVKCRHISVPFSVKCYSINLVPFYKGGCLSRIFQLHSMHIQWNTYFEASWKTVLFKSRLQWHTDIVSKYGVQNRNNIRQNFKMPYVSEGEVRDVVPVYAMKAYWEWRYNSTHF